MGTQLIKGEDVDWGKVGVAALSGAVSGGLVASGVGIIGQTVYGGLISAGTDAWMQNIDGGDYDWKQTAIAFGMGALAGAAGGKGLGKNSNISGAKNALNKLKNEETLLIKSGRYLDTLKNLDVMSSTRQNLVNTTVKEYSKAFGKSVLGGIGTNVIVFDYNAYANL